MLVFETLAIYYRALRPLQLTSSPARRNLEVIVASIDHSSNRLVHAVIFVYWAVKRVPNMLSGSAPLRNVGTQAQ